MAITEGADLFVEWRVEGNRIVEVGCVIPEALAEVFGLGSLRIGSLGAGNVQSFTARNTFSDYGVEMSRDVIYGAALALDVGGASLTQSTRAPGSAELVAAGRETPRHRLTTDYLAPTPDTGAMRRGAASRWSAADACS